MLDLYNNAFKLLDVFREIISIVFEIIVQFDLYITYYYNIIVILESSFDSICPIDHSCYSYKIVEAITNN